MAKISQFAARLIEHEDREPESIALFRKLSESEDIRVLLGDFFLRLAASEPPGKQTPHEDLLRRMIGARDLACEPQLQILARNLDLLRQYDIGQRAREKFRAMTQDARKNRELIEQTMPWHKEVPTGPETASTGVDILQ